MNLLEYEKYLGKFLKNYLRKSKADGFILGVSGGIDSAVVAALLSKYLKDKYLCLILPIHQNIDDAILVCNQTNSNYESVDLSNIFDTCLNNYEEGNKTSKSNLKVRLRMLTLYYYGQNRNMLVIGTDNACEYYTGYFTKYGDGAYDINPLRYLTKDQVYEMAKNLGVDQKIISKVPSADLIEGISDEDELKVSYKDLNKYLKGEKVSEEACQRIEYLHKISSHKRKLPVFPKKLK